MSLENIPFEVFNSSFEPVHYISLFNVSKHYRKLVCNHISQSDEVFLFTAIMMGDLNFIKWWKYKKYTIDKYHYISVAAHYDHLDIMKWWHHNMKQYDNYNHNVCCGTINNKNYIKILEWLYSLDSEYITKDYNILKKAAHLNNSEAMKWLCEHNASCDYQCYHYIIDNNNLEIMRHLHNNWYIMDRTIYQYSLANGTPEMSEFILNAIKTS